MNELREALILDAARTPFGKNRGGLSHIRTDDLAAVPIAELVKRHPALDPAEIDDVYYGNANGAGEDNRNVARMAALLAGLPVTVPGTSVNRLCASGNEALVQASRAIRLGDVRLVVAGGVEGMSRSPYVLQKPDEALPRAMKLEQTQIGWRMVNPKFPAHWTDSLGACAERVAAELGIGRDEQDVWAARSHQRVAAAYDKGLHDGFVIEVEGVRRDESLRPGTTVETLAELRPAFTKDGTVTAGNSSPINDGATALLLGNEEAAAALGVEPLGRIVASATTATEPDRFSVAPIDAINRVLERTGRTVGDIDLWEVNEAFSAMVLSTLAGLPGIDPERVNVNGGAIALGHPLGMSGGRLVTMLVHELQRTGGRYGLATMCIGVGQGIATVIERIDG